MIIKIICNIYAMTWELKLYVLYIHVCVCVYTYILDTNSLLDLQFKNIWS